MEYQIFIDGGSRGNPGPSAIGVVFLDNNGKLIKNYSKHLGIATNNEAEYSALIFALKKIKVLIGKENAKNAKIRIYSDSELLVRQMQGKYRIKNPKIQKLFLQAWNLKIDFSNLSFYLVPREENKQADLLVNQELDASVSKKSLF